MDNFAYLNEIAASNRPVQNPAAAPQKMRGATVIKIVAIGVVAFVMLMAVGALIGSLQGKTENLTKQLYLRTTNLSTVMQDYNKELKSSDLRTLGASLAGALTNATTQLTSYIGGEDAEERVPDAKTVEEETAVLEELTASLTNARLNGILDRAYANLVGLQVSLIMSMISELEERTSDAKLLEVLSAYRGNLEVLHQGFEAYDDPGA